MAMQVATRCVPSEDRLQTEPVRCRSEPAGSPGRVSLRLICSAEENSAPAQDLRPRGFRGFRRLQASRARPIRTFTLFP